MADTDTDVKQSWRTQVYDSDGKWVGFFQDEATAKKWVNKRPGYEITDRRPAREEREGLQEVTVTEPASEAV